MKVTIDDNDGEVIEVKRAMESDRLYVALLDEDEYTRANAEEAVKDVMLEVFQMVARRRREAGTLQLKVYPPDPNAPKWNEEPGADPRVQSSPI